jgi:hypothetical protein
MKTHTRQTAESKRIERRDYMRRRRAADPDGMRTYQQEWRKAHPELTKTHAQRTYLKHAERIKAYKRKWAEANKDRHREQARLWYQQNKQRVLQLRTERFFSLPEGGYAVLCALQHNRCLICGRKPRKRPLAVDHDHKTGKIRGLLCGTCNTGMGHLQDSPELLEKAAAYLRTRGTIDLREYVTQQGTGATRRRSIPDTAPSAVSQ